MSPECPVCGAQQAAPFWPSVWGDAGKTVQACGACDSFFLWPQNTPEEQEVFDRNYARYIEGRAKEVEPHTKAGFSQLVDDSISERLNDIETWFTGARSVLEIGAEEGGFLDRLRGQVPRLVAVDAAPEYVDILRRKGYDSYRYIYDVPSGLKFDLICFFSLLEHIRGSVGFLRRVAQHLEPNGRIVIEVPSARDPLVGLYDIPAFKDFYFQAMHPQVFSPRALEIVLDRAGFRNVSMRYKQRYGLQNHLQWLRKGVPGGAADLSAIIDGTAERAYIACLERAGMTDTVYVTAQAPAH